MQVPGFDAQDIPEPSIEWLRRYYCAVALAFVLSMAVVVYITILSIPQVGGQRYTRIRYLDYNIWRRFGSA